jgi:hypothetical protein
MAGPWEKYQDAQPQQPPATDGPWAKYSTQPEAPAEDRIVVLPAVQATLPDPTDGMSGYERFMAGAGKSVMDSAIGVGQFLSSDAAPLAFAVPGLVTRELDRRFNIGDRATQMAEEARVRDKPLMDTGAGMAGNIAGQVAQAAIPAGRGASVAGALGRAAPYVEAAVRGGALAGAQPVVGDQSRALNTAIGAGSGAAGQAVAAGAGALAQRASQAVQPAVAGAIAKAKQAGIPLHLAQISDSRFLKGLSSVLNTLPFSGAAGAGRNQQQAFNRAVSNTFGADAPVLTDDVMLAAKQGIGNVYDNVFSRNSVALNGSDLARLSAIESSAMRNMTADKAQVVRNQLDSIVENFANGSVTGPKYQSLRGELAGVTGDGAIEAAVKAMRRVVDDAAFRSVGNADAALLKQANSQWANLRTVQDALKQVAGASGDIRPSALWPMVRNGSTQEMRDLARLGQTVLKDPIPNSGTAERTVINNLLGLGGGAYLASNDQLPVWARLAGAGLLAGRVANSPAAANALLLSRPITAGGINGLSRLAQAAPYAIPAGVNALAFPAAAADDVPSDIPAAKGRGASRRP